MTYLRGLFLYTALASALPTFAQNETCQRRIVPVTVMDSGGHPITGFVPADFQAKFRGKPVKILSVVPDDRPRRIVILLDVSGSMRGMPTRHKWTLAREIASHLADTRLRNTSVALLVFSRQVNEQIGFSDGTPAVAKRLMQISADSDYVNKNVRGLTALYDAILAALRLLDAPGFSDSVYLISDGGDNKSRSSKRDAHRALVSAGVRFHASVLASTFPFPTPEELDGPAAITEIVRATGGIVFGPIGAARPGTITFDLSQEERSKLTVSLLDLYGDILSDALMEVELPESPNNWGEWSLELSAQKKKQFKNASIAYPRELVPCGVHPN